MSSVRTLLLRKELFLARWPIGIATLGGLVALFITSQGKLGFNIGSLCWLTSLIALGVMLPMQSLMQERKDRALLFTLSLPLSRGDHVRCKLYGLLVCFGLPWLLLSTGAVALVLLDPGLPDGLLPLVVLLCTFLLANFSVVVCVGLLTAAESAFTAAIIATNMSVTLFLFLVGGLDAIQSHVEDPTPSWNATCDVVLAAELALLALAIGLPLALADRRRDLL